MVHEQPDQSPGVVQNNVWGRVTYSSERSHNDPPPEGFEMAVQIGLDWNIHWCHKHLREALPNYPRGAIPAMIFLYHHSVHDPAIIEWCGGDITASDPTEGADPRLLPSALAKYAPLCCHLGDDVVQLIAEAVADELSNE